MGVRKMTFLLTCVVSKEVFVNDIRFATSPNPLHYYMQLRETTILVHISTIIILFLIKLNINGGYNMDFNFGNRLKSLRLQSGMTQQQLADKIGITKSVISFYELRERTPSPEILIKLAAEFKVSSDYLLGIEKTKILDITGLDEEDERIVKLVVDRLRKKNIT